ncbi:MAG: GNAT family protein [Dehalococcoidia bacterium]
MNIFHGERIRLGERRLGDEETVAAWSNDVEYLFLQDSRPALPRSQQDVARGPGFMGSSPNRVQFWLRTLEEDRLIGFLAINQIQWNNQHGWLAIGIGNRDDRGRGYGGEALRLGLNYAFNELNLHRISLTTLADNARAIRAYERAGFKREGVLRATTMRAGRRYDDLAMGLLRREWLDLTRGTPQ